MTTTTPATRATPAIRVLCAVDAVLLAISGIIHLRLWFQAYRHVPTLDILFLLQVIAAFVLAIALIVVRHRLVVAAALALVLGTIAGYFLALTVGIFGFKDPGATGESNLVLAVEIAAVILLAITGWLMVRPAGRSA
jgi:cytochrome b subunit of formate dehydrogenase